MRFALTFFSALLLASQALAQAPDRLPPSQLLIEQLRSPLGVATDTGPVRTMPPLALELIMDFEGWSASAYNDPVGYCTIGYGHLIALSRCEQIQLGRFAGALTRPEGAALLEEDTRLARAAVRDLVTVELTESQYGALSSFVFNVGRANFTGSTLLELVNDGQAQSAAAEFRRWVWSRGQILPGLVTRRACEEALFVGALRPNREGLFDRSLCQSLGIAGEAGPPIDVETGEVQRSW